MWFEKHPNITFGQIKQLINTGGHQNITDYYCTICYCFLLQRISKDHKEKKNFTHRQEERIMFLLLILSSFSKKRTISSTSRASNVLNAVYVREEQDNTFLITTLTTSLFSTCETQEQMIRQFTILVEPHLLYFPKSKCKSKILYQLIPFCFTRRQDNTPAVTIIICHFFGSKPLHVVIVQFRTHVCKYRPGDKEIVMGSLLQLYLEIWLS